MTTPTYWIIFTTTLFGAISLLRLKRRFAANLAERKLYNHGSFIMAGASVAALIGACFPVG